MVALGTVRIVLFWEVFLDRFILTGGEVSLDARFGILEELYHLIYQPLKLS